LSGSQNQASGSAGGHDSENSGLKMMSLAVSEKEARDDLVPCILDPAEDKKALRKN
jgi:hypothetical protein